VYLSLPNNLKVPASRVLTKVDPENAMPCIYVISEYMCTSVSHSASFSTNSKSMRDRYSRALLRKKIIWVTA
jgi:hypothetical protein